MARHCSVTTRKTTVARSAFLIPAGLIRGALALAATATLGGCDAGPRKLSVDGAWVRLAAVPGRPAAAYFTVHGAEDTPATLISVTTDVAIRAEMHESMANGMRPIDRVAVPAGADLPFAPGGRHVMLFSVNPGIKPGALMTLTLTFADGTRLQRKATVLAAGTPAPA